METIKVKIYKEGSTWIAQEFGGFAITGFGHSIKDSLDDFSKNFKSLWGFTPNYKWS